MSSVYYGFHICPIYNIFHLPCPGCGLSRGFLAIITKFDLIMATKWNILSVPLFTCFIVSFLWIIKDLIKKEDTLLVFLRKKPKYYIYIILITVMITTWIININNPMLY